MFISDIPHLKNAKYLYADDVALSFTAKQLIIDALISALNHVIKYCWKSKLKINEAKTEAIYFTRRIWPSKLPATGITINKTEVPCSKSVKY